MKVPRSYWTMLVALVFASFALVACGEDDKDDRPDFGGGEEITGEVGDQDVTEQPDTVADTEPGEDTVPDTEPEQVIPTDTEPEQITPDTTDTSDGDEPEVTDVEEEEVQFTCEENTDCYDQVVYDETQCEIPVCVDGVCQVETSTSDFCCLSAADCDDGNQCTNDLCPTPGAACIHDPDTTSPECVCPENVVFLDEDFEMGSYDLSFMMIDDQEDDFVAWNVTTAKSVSGVYSVYFGDPDCQTYYSGELDAQCQPTDPLETDAGRVSGCLMTDTFSLPANAVTTLTFWAWMDVEPGGYPFDLLRVKVNGSNNDIVFNNEAPFERGDGEDWYYYASDLSTYAGETIYLEICFDSLDFNNNYFEGVYLDDLKLQTACDAVLCSTTQPCGDDGDGCTEDACILFDNSATGGGMCAYPKTDPDCEFCTIDADCEATPGSCLMGSCVDSKCVYSPDPECCDPTDQVVVFEDDFETMSTDDWTLDALDADNVGWQLDDTRAASGMYSLYFGDTTDQTYDTGAAVSGKAMTPLYVLPMNTGGTPLLTFELFLSTEWDDAATFDDTVSTDTLTVSVLAAGVTTEVWTSAAIEGTTDGAFELIGINLEEFLGASVQIIFEFDSYDEFANQYEGVYIDDVTIRTSCGAPCTLDSECDDSFQCTVDACVAGLCDNLPIDNCCEVDDDCDDGDDCTVDVCEPSGQCSYSDSGDPNCCTEGQKLVWGFEDGMPAGFAADPSEGDVIWQVSTEQSSTGVSSLYFGDAATLSYDTGDQVIGTITSAPFTVPSGGVSYVSFALYLDTEWFGDPADFVPPQTISWDLLELAVVKGAVETVIWDSYVYEVGGSTCDATGACAFMTVEASLYGFNNQEVQLAFTFDSYDGVDNLYEGVYIDDLEVVTACDFAGDCFSSMECDDDGDPTDTCTKDQCIDYVCVFEETGDPACCYAEEIYAYDFETADLMGWDASDAIGNVSWQLNQNNTHAGDYAVYFGDVTTYTYEALDTGTSIPVSGTLSSELVELPAGADYSLTFWMWMDVEKNPAFDTTDYFSVTVTPLATGEAVTVFENRTPYLSEDDYQAWTEYVVDLSDYAGQQLLLEFGFDSGDGANNTGEGIYLDDIVITADCP